MSARIYYTHELEPRANEIKGRVFFKRDCLFKYETIVLGVTKHPKMQPQLRVKTMTLLKALTCTASLTHIITKT